MRQRLICGPALFLLGTFALLAGQEAPQAPQAAPPAGSPVAPQPKIKSQKELEAIQAIGSALDPASRIKACEDLIKNFADSEFKTFALQMAALSAQEANDYEKMMIYGERTLEADPDNYMVLVAMASGLAQRTREFDLDKEEKLKRSADYANRALKALGTALRPNPNITEEQWEGAKRDFRAQAHESLGMGAMVRKDYDTAIAEFKTAIDTGATPNPGVKLRLAAALNEKGNHDEAIAMIDDILADADLHPQIRSIAQNERLRATQMKEAKAKK